MVLLLVCHWIACVWWAIGAGGDNLLASFGTSWIFREGQADCAALSDDARADAIAAVDVLADELGGTASISSRPEKLSLPSS